MRVTVRRLQLQLRERSAPCSGRASPFSAFRALAPQSVSCVAHLKVLSLASLVRPSVRSFAGDRQRNAQLSQAGSKLAPVHLAASRETNPLPRQTRESRVASLHLHLKRQSGATISTTAASCQRLGECVFVCLPVRVVLRSRVCDRTC